MTKTLFCLLMSVSLTACMTQYVKLPDVPVPQNIEAQQGAPIVGLAPVEDSRGNENLGNIGVFLRLAVGVEMREYLHRLLKQRLRKTGLCVIDAPKPRDLRNMRAADIFGARILQVTIRSATMSSPDAVFVPAQADVIIVVQLYDLDGKVMYANAYSGTNSELIGISGPSGKTEGTILSVAISDAVEKMMKDQTFIGTITRVAPGRARTDGS